MRNILELRRERAKLWHEAKEILDKYSNDEVRSWAGEDEQKFDRLLAEIDKLDERIQREERLYERKKEEETTEEPVRPAVENRAQQASQEEYREAFSTYLRYGVEGLNPEQRSLLAQNFNQLPAETRALSAITGASGGYTVPQSFYNQLIDNMKWFGGMRQSRATVIRTSGGNQLPIPTADDTGNMGAIVAENSQVAEQDIGSFGQKMLNAYMFTSKIIRVPYQLLQDSAFDIEAYLRQKLAERIGRATNNYFTVGTGSSQPQGVVTGAASGKVGATGQTTSVTYDDLVDLVHSVDPAYRRQAQFMFHDTTLKALKKLKDAQNRPLWLPGLAQSEPDTILGYPYVINNDMPVMAANAKSILFGDFSYYFIRDVLGIQLLRLQEKYADYLQVGFLAFSRHDGLLADSGAGMIRYYQNSAT